MKTRNGRLNRRFHAARLGLCVIVVIAAVGGLPMSGQAAGVITHSDNVGRAIEKLIELDKLNKDKDYSALVTLLKNQQSVVNYGSIFPDWGLAKNKEPWMWSEEEKNAYEQMSEIAHDTCYYLHNGYQSNNKLPLKFRETLTAYLKPTFIQNPQSVSAEIAFLFGVIAHQEADFRWHFGNGFQYWAVTKGQNHAGLEWDTDLYLSYLNYKANLPYEPDVDWDSIPFQTLIDIYALAPFCTIDNNPNHQGDIIDVHFHPVNQGQLQSGNTWQHSLFNTEKTASLTFFGDGTPLSLSKLQADWNREHCNWFWFWCTNWITPHELLMNYPEGGLNDMALQTAKAWMQTWDFLNNTNTSTIR